MENMASLLLAGQFRVQCFDKCGNLKWDEVAKNGVVTAGLNHVLDIEFHASAQVTAWYIGLISLTGYTGLAAADTLVSHAGWTEGANYTGTRKEWTEGAAAAGSMTNAVSVDFAMNATTTIKGAFLCSVTSGTAGTLYCTALFTGGDQAVASGDTLKITYTLTAAAA